MSDGLPHVFHDHKFRLRFAHHAQKFRDQIDRLRSGELARGAEFLARRPADDAIEATRERMEAAHVDYAGDKGMGTKVSDRYAVPMCPQHHQEQHALGWETFEAKYKITALSASVAYWKLWPKRPEWEAKFL